MTIYEFELIVSRLDQLEQRMIHMDAQVTLLQNIVANVQTVVTKLALDVAAALVTVNTAIDSQDEQAITAANVALQNVVTALQTLDASLTPAGTTGATGAAS